MAHAQEVADARLEYVFCFRDDEAVPEVDQGSQAPMHNAGTCRGLCRSWSKLKWRLFAYVVLVVCDGATAASLGSILLDVSLVRIVTLSIALAFLGQASIVLMCTKKPQVLALQDLEHLGFSLRLMAGTDTAVTLWWCLELGLVAARSAGSKQHVVAVLLGVCRLVPLALIMSMAFARQSDIIKVGTFAELPEALRTEDQQCIICLAGFEPCDRVLPLPCRHIYHSECLRHWLVQKETCPLRCGGALIKLPSSARAGARPAASRAGA